MPSTNLSFSSRDQHRAWLQSQAALPLGFRVGSVRFGFTPAEVTKPATMALTLVTLDRPTPDFAAVFTRNALPGAPVLLGRRRLDEPTLGAIIINNKISNVCAPEGEAIAERICAATATAVGGLDARQVLPSSTGIIGWRLPATDMIANLPRAVAALSATSALPAADGIMTTDLYPKLRSVDVAGGRLLGFAKGAGMIEPHLATMLVYLLTDLQIPRADLRAMLRRAVEPSFNSISVDSDTSTSDTVALLSSGARPCADLAGFEHALHQICADLAEDVVRNGEGVQHVIRVRITGAPNADLARSLGRAVVNSPLVKTAISGNDPNVGRFVAALGKHLGLNAPGLDLSRLRLDMGGHTILSKAQFLLTPDIEARLVHHLKTAQLYESAPTPSGIFKPPIDYPPHERSVEVQVDLGVGDATATVWGSDLTHEYISENADYRS